MRRARKKDEEIGHIPKDVKSTDQAAAKSSSTEMASLSHRDAKSLKKLSREERQIEKMLVRERKGLRSLEEKERELLEEGEWSNNRTTTLGNFGKIGRPSKKCHKPDIGATGLGKEIKINVPSTKNSKKKADPALWADLMVMEVISVERKRLIGLLDLIGSMERRQRKRLEEIPW